MTAPTNAARAAWNPGCRVCNAPAVTSLPIAIYAPFFRLRVDVGRDPFALYSSKSGLRVHRGPGLAARLTRALVRASERVAGIGDRRFLRTTCDFCSGCQSLTLSHAYSYSDLAPLYADYRSKTYNADRISVEPSYRSIAHLVGQDPKERSSRNEGVTAFLRPFLPTEARGRALDLGGADGQFIPHEVIDCFSETHIVDTSDAEVDEAMRAHGVRKVPRPDEAGYGLVMCMHVLEHVGSPRQFVLDSLQHLQPGGLLYLEVPLELDPLIPAQFQARLVDHSVTIHEHINQFHASSIARLVESIGSLRLLKAEHASIDCGWTTGTVARVLAERLD